MALEDDVISSLLSVPGELNEKPDQLYKEIATIPEDETVSAMLSASNNRSDKKDNEPSPEDAAWADSCLAVDPNMSEDSWGALREALLETLNADSTSLEQTGMDYFDNNADDLEHVPDNDEVETSVVHSKEIHVSSNMIKGDTGGDEEGNPNVEEFVESRETIFKVWDLEIPDEEDEDELIQQLNRLLSGSKLGPSPSNSSNPAAVLDEVKVDELVTGISDLSLQQSSD